jgi:hypothetical protein
VIGMSGFTRDLEIATAYTPAEICGILHDKLPFVTGGPRRPKRQILL